MLKIENITDLNSIKNALGNEIKIIPLAKNTSVIETHFCNSGIYDYFVHEVENGLYKVSFNDTDYAINQFDFTFRMNSNHIEIIEGTFKGRKRKADRNLKIFNMIAILINSVLLTTDVF